MPEYLKTPDELAKFGIEVTGKIMDNGEKRARMMVGDVGYIWTEPPEAEKPSWQNAHYHRGTLETYIVQRGQMAFAERSDDGHERSVRIYRPGEIVTSRPVFPHNVYLFGGAAIHTVKHGEAVGNPDKGGVDWYPADEDFDQWTKSLSEVDIFRLAGR